MKGNAWCGPCAKFSPARALEPFLWRSGLCGLSAATDPEKNGFRGDLFISIFELN